MTTIKNGHFRSEVDKLLSNGSDFCHTDLNFEDTIKLDQDPVNRQKRLNWYNKKRQLVYRLASFDRQIDIESEPEVNASDD